MPWYLEEISKCTYRQFTTGFYFGKPDENTQIYDNNTYEKEYTYLGIVSDVCEDGSFHISQRNKFFTGEEIEVMKPDGENIPVRVISIHDEEGNAMESAPHPKQQLTVLLERLDGTGERNICSEYDILRKKEDQE